MGIEENEKAELAKQIASPLIGSKLFCKIPTIFIPLNKNYSLTRDSEIIAKKYQETKSNRFMIAPDTFINTMHRIEEETTQGNL